MSYVQRSSLFRPSIPCSQLKGIAVVYDEYFRMLVSDTPKGSRFSSPFQLKDITTLKRTSQYRRSINFHSTGIPGPRSTAETTQLGMTRLIQPLRLREPRRLRDPSQSASYLMHPFSHRVDASKTRLSASIPDSKRSGPSLLRVCLQCFSKIPKNHLQKPCH